MPQRHAPNLLAGESSPYLLQHAHNPVKWYPWGEEAFSRAVEENKLVLVSIGYSACHWCHVMEKESFENEDTARLMNDSFICIKVDREERPDVDQVYMTAVQLMTGQGGWPLNCFTLPDGRPVYGGTYFPNASWNQILRQLSMLHKNEPAKVEEYAQKLTEGIRQAELVQASQDERKFSIDDARAMYQPWKENFDTSEGGPNRAPKFPLPSNYDFLLRYYYHTKDEEALGHVSRSLTRMAWGGIFDQLGGGFARYSTDMEWKVPHFEKMLYDNAQLVSLYSEAFQLTGDPLFREVVYDTLGFVAREMTSPEGAFYSALDADSEGEEGRFYVWQKPELQNLLGEDFPVFADYYSVNAQGFWEHGNYILLRRKPDEEVAAQHGMDLMQLKAVISRCREILMSARAKRVRPGLDDKQLTSWNALMLKGYTDAYRVFGEERFLEAALRNAEFILTKASRPDGGLNHSYKDGKSVINGYLEDYCFTIEALISLYQATFSPRWITEALRLTEYTISHFRDPHTGMFFFTSDLDRALIARKMEINDNVIPASNSSFAKCLYLLGRLMEKPEYTDAAKQMLRNVRENMPIYGSGYSNWGVVLLYMAAPFHEVAVTGDEAESIRREMEKHYLPNKVLAGSSGPGSLPLLQDRYQEGKTLIYICENSSCQLPVATLQEALDLIRA